MTNLSFTLSLDKQEQIFHEDDKIATECISFKFTLPVDPKQMTEQQKNGIVELFQLLHPYEKALQIQATGHHADVAVYVQVKCWHLVTKRSLAVFSAFSVIN